MPVKRRLSKLREHAIDAEAVLLFERGLRLRARRHRSIDDMRAYGSAASDLDRALNVRLWSTSVLDTVGETKPPSWMHHHLELALWDQAAELRRQLEAALAAQRARVSLVTIPSPPETAFP